METKLRDGTLALLGPILLSCCASAPARGSVQLPEVQESAPGETPVLERAEGPAQLTEQEAAVPRRRQFSSGIGFTADPDTFLFGTQLDLYLNESVAAGPLIQWGVDDDTTIIAPSLNVKGVFDLSDPLESPVLHSLHPYVQTGLGFAYIEKDRRRGDEDDFAFLLTFGGGLDVELSESVSVGSGMHFNFLPDEAVDERFFFSWQVLTLGFRF